jgi:hypothetical protein
MRAIIDFVSCFVYRADTFCIVYEMGYCLFMLSYFVFSIFSDILIQIIEKITLQSLHEDEVYAYILKIDRMRQNLARFFPDILHEILTCYL